jgi:hypothetical protein
MSPAPVCPRCGYDQFGVVRAWDTAVPPACPMAGVCSECGLCFEWASLFHPERAVRAWSFEHARGRLVAALLGTYGWTLRPWRLWQVVRMEQPVVWHRLLAFALVGMLLSAAIAVGVAVICGPAYKHAHKWFLRSGRMWPLPGWSDTFRFQQLIAWRIEDLLAVTHWRVVCALALALTPAMYVLMPATLCRAAVRPRHLVRVWLYGLAVVPLALVASLAVQTVLAITFLLDVRLHPGGLWLEGIGVALWRYAAPVWVASVLLWAWAWWGLAARRYLRLQHAWWVAGAMVLLAFLLATGLVALIPGGAAGLVGGL